MRPNPRRARRVRPELKRAPSTVIGHADLAAVHEDGARQTPRPDTRADVLAERDQETVEVDPVPFRHALFQLTERRLRRARTDVAPAVRHTLHVYVDRDARLAARDPEDEIRTLGTDAREGPEHRRIAREPAAVLLGRTRSERLDLSRLPLVE